MSTKLSEEKYKDLKKIATQEHKKYDVEEMTADEKDKISSRIVNNRKFDNDEMKEIFIANFLIPDDQKFYQTYMENGKSIKKSAEVLNVSEKVVFTRVFELGKYSAYIHNLKNKKGDDKMKEIEIIDGLPLTPDFKKEENIVEDNALKAINKINKLIDSNMNKDKTIDSQAKTINKLNDDIDNLHFINNEQNDTINSLEADKSNLEQRVKELETILKAKEKEIKLIKKHFEKVPQKAIKTGKSKVFMLNVFGKNPEIYPITVLSKLFKPNGHPLKKSMITPDEKPEITPIQRPCAKETYNEQRSKKSGTTGRNMILESIADSKRAKPK